MSDQGRLRGIAGEIDERVAERELTIKCLGCGHRLPGGPVADRIRREWSTW